MTDSASNPPAKQTLDKVIQIDTAQLEVDLGGLVRQRVEDTLNVLCNTEADLRRSSGILPKVD